MSRLVELYHRRLLREFTGGAASKDARVGMGYGRASTPTGAGGEYSARDDFPYTDGPTELDDEVEAEDPWSDENEVDVFLRKTGHRSWRNSGNHADRGSLAHSSQRGLGETNIVAIPGLYRTPTDNDETGRKHYTAFKTGPGHKGGITPGSKAGWFGAPPPMMSDVGEPAYTLQDIPCSVERALQNAQADHASLVGDLDQSFSDDPEAIEDSELDW